MRALTTLSVMLLIGACGSPEVLLPHSRENAVGVSFAGQWELNENPDAIADRLNRAIRETAGIRVDIFQPGRNAGNGRNRQRTSGGLAHVFLENGESLKVTQTPSAIFISFDRAVVEEFRFGENREITLGEVEAQRVSGWEGSEYVVDTLGRNRMKLTERLSLSGDRQTLIRKIVFRSKQKEEVTVVETFSRR